MPLILYSPKRKSTADANWHNVSFLANFESGLIDVKTGAALTPIGTVTNVSYGRFGKGAEFSNSYLELTDTSIANFGTADFTVEMWIKPTTIGRYSGIFTTNLYGRAYGLNVRLTSDNKLNIYSASALVIKGTTVFAANTWYHIAIVRRSGTLYAYVNGVQDSTMTYAVPTSTSFIRIGDESQGAYKFIGVIDDVRITKNIARYTGNFTVPAAEYPTLS